ncbi:MAG: hypothetical protein HY304_04640, partial [candidate division Zixibacteria bacterium]|nr:hypothetical protein [candidate division Zixibacteria bacterium]
MTLGTMKGRSMIDEKRLSEWGCAVLGTIVMLACASAARADGTSADSLKEKIDRTTEVVSGINERLSAAEADIAHLKKFKVSGYVQARYEYHDDAISSPKLGTGSTDSKNQGKLLNRFYVRRGRVKMTYQANPNALGVVYFDGSASGVSLKEAYVALTEPKSGLVVTAGQF